MRAIIFIYVLVATTLISLLECKNICTCWTADLTSSQSCCSFQNSTCSSKFDDKIVLEDDTLILVCSDSLELETIVRIDNKTNVQILGNSFAKSNVTCSKSAGFLISNSNMIKFKNIRLIGCGVLQESTSYSEKGKLLFTASLHISNSVDIVVENVDIEQSNGTGMVLLNSYGTVNECDFRQNRVDNSIILPGGGGLYVEFSSNTPNDPVNFEEINNFLIVQNCNFSDNEAITLGGNAEYTSCNSKNRFNGFGRGGGLAIFFLDNASNVTVVVENVYLTKNKAIWGGAMYIHFCSFANENKLNVKDVTFVSNTCENYGGGGIDFGITPNSNVIEAQRNRAYFLNCTFERNRAFFGGGMTMYMSENKADLENSVTFVGCTWKGNIADYGSALDIAPSLIRTPHSGYYPEIKLKDATFMDNIITRQQRNNSKVVMKKKKRMGHAGCGAFLVVRMNITFEGSLRFYSNNGSAIYAVSTIFLFVENTTAHFINNNGLHGGAMALHGFSALWMQNKTSVTMENNSAALGGAIYHRSIDKHDYLFSHSCFIQTAFRTSSRQYVQHGDINFYFRRNRAHSHIDNKHRFIDGNSMYVTTLIPCSEYCNVSLDDGQEKLFSCIGNFEFDKEKSVATSGAYFNVSNETLTLEIIPGNRVELPFSLFDDLDQKSSALYHLDSDTDKIVVDGLSTYTAENEVILKGLPGTRGQVTVEKIGLRELILTYQVILVDCPPFFEFNKELNKCLCSFHENAKFKNIHSCNLTEYTSSLLHGYWAGYDGNKTADNFRYGICPATYCFYKNESERYHKLPRNDDLEEAVCGARRFGILCGRCREGYCVYYHSGNFVCRNCSSHSCKPGWILYIVSELIPLTILFLLVVAFNVNFTSGYLNGFIFYAQVFDSLFTIGKNFIYYPNTVFHLVRIVQVVYKLFNFDFFADDKLSFCLWKDATTIELLAFKFITVVIAGALVVFTVAFMKRCAFSKDFLKSLSMVHGLSAFLVMVYTQCTKVSFQLLDNSRVLSLQGTERRVLFFQGDIELFSKEHIPFATIAIFCLLTLTTIPPLFLISYPLSYRVSSLLHLDNTAFTRLIGRLLPVSKLKPVFDSFQGAFKDKYRFFAGLYFIYRVMLLASVLTSDPTLTYTFTQIQLIAMLTIHCVCWPYIKRTHNVIDALILSNLAIINALTLFNYNYSQESSSYQETVNISSYIQLLFIYAPLVYLIGYIIYSTCIIFRRRLKKDSSNNIVEDEIIMERLDDSDEEKQLSNSYRILTDTY